MKRLAWCVWLSVGFVASGASAQEEESEVASSAVEAPTSDEESPPATNIASEPPNTTLQEPSSEQEMAPRVLEEARPETPPEDEVAAGEGTAGDADGGEAVPRREERSSVANAEEPAEEEHTIDRAHDRWRPWFAALGHLSLLSDRLAASTLNIRFGYGLNVGARRGPWGVYGHLEQNLWTETEFDFIARAGTLNIAAGGERFFFRERLRVAAALGVSILLTDQALHSAPNVGLFVQLKPAGIRFARRSQVVIQLDIASVTIVAPVVSSPSVVDIQYRSTVAIEWQGSH